VINFTPRSQSPSLTRLTPSYPFILWSQFGAPNGGRCCTHQAAGLFCVKWRHGRHDETMPICRKFDSVKFVNRWVYLYLENPPAKFHPDPIWNDGAKSFLKSDAVAPTTRITTRWVAIWDQFLI